ncbi:hypothetical protein DCAR_0832124 [Daucus carota subsp. sativus]|uniref:Uncharacterized protein n=1 Tax=Daucus carota subsp. sativus TaxID=79200 RepID=A0AAF0XQX3_DAUCS|nr:hypothetical protein DCAR_0832124 [Daucus carota subsp. sativus]
MLNLFLPSRTISSYVLKALHLIEENANSLDDNHQLAVYTPADPAASDGTVTQPPQNQVCRIAPSVEAYTVQYSLYYKWRLIPSKKRFEEIREHLIEKPFVCRALHQRLPQISCTVDLNFQPDGSKLWAIETPNITRPPSGWERILKIKGPQGTRFADVFADMYYYTSSHERLLSTVEVRGIRVNIPMRYPREHPSEVDGADLTQFSFKIPILVKENSLEEHTTLARTRNLSNTNTSLKPLELHKQLVYYSKALITYFKTFVFIFVSISYLFEMSYYFS